MFTILNQVPESLTLFAPDCSSWGAPNRGTSMRSILNPSGFTNHRSVAAANCMVSRKLGMQFCTCIARLGFRLPQVTERSALNQDGTTHPPHIGQQLLVSG